MICLVRALFAPRLASRALSVLNNNQGMRSRRARLLARVAAPNRSHTLAWHASDRGPRFSLSRAGELGSSLHRQREERPCERFMASRRGSRHVYADRPELSFWLACHLQHAKTQLNHTQQSRIEPKDCICSDYKHPLLQTHCSCSIKSTDKEQ